MNPMTNIKNLQKLNERELELGIIGKKSWHDEYRESAWIFVGGLPYDLSEGDIICVFSQYGEIVNINLVRDNKTGKSKGYAFICFQDQRSTVLSVDNLNGIKILGRTIRVDHVKDYKMPKERGDEDETTLQLRHDGCAPKIESSPEEVENVEEKDTKKKRKKEKKKKVKKEKNKKKKHKNSSDEDSSCESEKEEKNGRLSNIDVKKEKMDIKEEKMDIGYDKAFNQYSSKMKGSRHDSTGDDSDDERKNRRVKDHDMSKLRMKNGVKDERWKDRDWEKREREGMGNDRRDRSDNQRYDRERDYREEDYRTKDFDRRRGDADREGGCSYRDRDSSRNDDYKGREYRIHSHHNRSGGSGRTWDDNEHVEDHRRQAERNGDSHNRRTYRRSRSSSKDRSQSRKRKHRSRSRSRDR